MIGNRHIGKHFFLRLLIDRCKKVIIRFVFVIKLVSKRIGHQIYRSLRVNNVACSILLQLFRIYNLIPIHLERTHIHMIMSLKHHINAKLVKDRNQIFPVKFNAVPFPLCGIIAGCVGRLVKCNEFPLLIRLGDRIPHPIDLVPKLLMLLVIPVDRAILVQLAVELRVIHHV
ncbi:hypothetical protein D3C75_797730 [compost metagenome]